MMAELAAGYLAAHQMQPYHHFVMQPASVVQGLPSYSRQVPFELRGAFHSDPVLFVPLESYRQQLISSSGGKKS
jgi:hypothetical protein